LSLAEAHFVLDRPAGCLAYSLRRAAAQPARGTLVLLHGLASNRSRYAEFSALTGLARDWNIVRLDLRGHGQSTTQSALSLEAWSGDLAALLDALEADRAVVVGHSLGAQVALDFAARHAARVAGLVLIDPLPQPALNARARRWRAALPALRLLAAALRLAHRLGLSRGDLPLRDLHAEDEAARALLAAGLPLDDFVRQYASVRADLRYVRSATYAQDFIELLRPAPAPEAIAAPVLVLVSAAGTFAEPAALSAWARRFPHGEEAIIHCHHWPLTERPEEVRGLIEAWVGRALRV